MPHSELPGTILRFGEFELDLRRHELRRNGVPIALQEQPFRILCCLLENPGELISRECLRNRLWEAGVFVEYEKCINTAVMKLRAALGDSAHDPQFVQTVPRLGFRFVADVNDCLLPAGSVPRRSDRLPEGAEMPDVRVGALDSELDVHGTSAAPRGRAEPDAPDPDTITPAVRRPSLVLLAGFALGMSVVAVGLHAVRQHEVVDSTQLVARLLVYPQHGTEIAGSFALSPDGSSLVFVADDFDSGTSRLWLRPLSGTESTPIPGTEGASLPFWSPDGRRVAFFADGRLKRTDLAGTVPTVIADAPRGRGGSWSNSGTILFSPNIASSILAVPDVGGESRPVTALGADPSHRFPFALPDGRHFLYLVLRNDRSSSDLRWGDLESVQSGRVAFGSPSGANPPFGRLPFVRGDSLIAQRLDAPASQPATSARGQ